MAPSPRREARHGKGGVGKRLRPTPYILHHTPYTLHPTPYTLQPSPYTLHPTPKPKGGADGGRLELFEGAEISIAALLWWTNGSSVMANGSKSERGGVGWLRGADLNSLMGPLSERMFRKSQTRTVCHQHSRVLRDHICTV